MLAYGSWWLVKTDQVVATGAALRAVSLLLCSHVDPLQMTEGLYFLVSLQISDLVGFCTRNSFQLIQQMFIEQLQLLGAPGQWPETEGETGCH